MKTFFPVTFLLFFVHVKMFALDASVTYATFNSTAGKYLEVYLHVVGQTVEFVPIDSLQGQAMVDVIILFKQGGEIQKFDKFRLKSPVSSSPLNFVDMKRYLLDNGTYELEVSVEDINREGNARSFSTPFIMDYPESGVSQSDVLLLQAYRRSKSGGIFVKNGYFMEPLPFNFLDKQASRLLFYSEIYGADQLKGDKFSVRYFVQEIQSTGLGDPILVGNQQYALRAFSVVLIQKDISKLPSGNYRLTVEVRSDANELVSSKVLPFQRSNPYLSFDEDAMAIADLSAEFINKLDKQALRYGLKAIAPVIPMTEVVVLNMVIENENDLEAQKRYLFSYWARQNPNNPEKAYEDYMQVAKAVDEKYRSGFGYGFETDRGHTYLKYGQPDDMVYVDTEPTAPPYEIWIYYEFPATRQTNVKFLFYNPSLVHNDFLLLHSTARGEKNNPQWQLELYNRSPNDVQGTNFRDATDMQDTWNRNAARYFNDF